MDKTEEKRVEDLLVKAHSIINQSRELEKLKGENFNLFAILDRQSNEVKTHSALIAELLNPKGSHGLGAVFLQHFIDIINKKWDFKINTNELANTQIEVERVIGKVLDKDSRLDILLSNKDFLICIENKIYACDQPLQLERYSEYMVRNAHQDKLLLYLNLEGEEYKDSNTKLKDNKDYFRISYRDDVLLWLNECLKESVNYPILRETIKQYIILIKKLTFQLTSDKMKNEVQKIILSDIESAEKIKQEYDEAITTVSKDLRLRVKENLKIEYPELNIWHQDWNQFRSIFIESKDYDYKIGIESFNGKGHSEGSLFIGAIDFDKKDKNRRYINGGWIDGTCYIIWNRIQLFKKLQDFANGNQETKDAIVNEIIVKIEDFISKYWSN